jgi:formamidopyrimidine-DNA glycosylase
MELPEISILACQMHEKLNGKRIAEVEVANSNCLNMPLYAFKEILLGKEVSRAWPRGKWVFIGLTPGYVLLFNTGMGADVLYYEAEEELPEKYHIKIVFDDKSGFTVKVWWFCYLHLVSENNLSDHKLTGELGLSPLEDGFTQDYFKEILDGRRGGIKSFLMNQRNVAGIGNVYIQDILFRAGLHPFRKISTLTECDIEVLYTSMRGILSESIEQGGLRFEKNFLGEHGDYGMKNYRVAYKTGEPCPICGSTIEKIKTGSTSGYICPKCQALH